jgi:hypothetical protein
MEWQTIFGSIEEMKIFPLWTTKLKKFKLHVQHNQMQMAWQFARL